MPTPVEFEGSNAIWVNLKVLQCQSLPIFTNKTHCVSCWEFSEEEIQEIIKTKRIFVSVWSGKTQPPVFIGTKDQVREQIADYGVW